MGIQEFCERKKEFADAYVEREKYATQAAQITRGVFDKLLEEDVIEPKPNIEDGRFNIWDTQAVQVASGHGLILRFTEDQKQTSRRGEDKFTVLTKVEDPHVRKIEVAYASYTASPYAIWYPSLEKYCPSFTADDLLESDRELVEKLQECAVLLGSRAVVVSQAQG